MPILPLLAIAAALAGGEHWEPAEDGAVSAYNLGAEALMQGDPVAAEKHLRKALRRDSGCGMCSGALAAALLYQDRAPEAYALASELMERFPDQLPLARTLAEAAFAIERFEQSIAIAESLLLADPENIDSLRLLAQGLMRTGDTARARAALQQASAHHDPKVLACELGKVELEEGHIEQARQQLVLCRLADQPDALAALESRILTAEGRYEEAAAVLSEDVDPVMSAVLTARRLMQAEDYQGAASLLRQAVQADPHAGEVVVLLGLCELRLGRPEQAMAALETAFEGDTWIRVDRRGGVAGILTASGEQSYLRQVREGASELVVLQLDLASVTEARVTLERVQAKLGASAELAAAELRLLIAEGRYGDAAAAAVVGLQRWPDSSLLLDTADFLGTNHPLARTPELAQALSAAGEWSALYNSVAELNNAGDYAGCLARAREAPAFADPAVQARLARLAHACAAAARDLTAADALIEPAGGPAALEPSARFNHASLLLQLTDDEEGTLALVTAAEPPADNPALGLAFRSLEVDIYARRDALEPALAVLVRGPVDPVARMNIAVLLANVERYAEAVPLLRSACQEQDDELELMRCQSLLAAIEGML